MLLSDMVKALEKLFRAFYQPQRRKLSSFYRILLLFLSLHFVSCQTSVAGFKMKLS